MKPRPGDLWLLWIPIDIKRGIARIHFQRATIKADSARAMELARIPASSWNFRHRTPVSIRATVTPVTEQSAMVAGIVKSMAGDVQRDASDLAE